MLKLPIWIVVLMGVVAILGALQILGVVGRFNDGVNLAEAVLSSIIAVVAVRRNFKFWSLFYGIVAVINGLALI